MVWGFVNLGRQSLHAFTLSYFLLARAGRQMEPPDID